MNAGPGVPEPVAMRNRPARPVPVDQDRVSPAPQRTGAAHGTGGIPLSGDRPPVPARVDQARTGDVRRAGPGAELPVVVGAPAPESAVGPDRAGVPGPPG